MSNVSLLIIDVFSLDNIILCNRQKVSVLCENFHKFTQHTDSLSVTKNDLS